MSDVGTVSVVTATSVPVLPHRQLTGEVLKKAYRRDLRQRLHAEQQRAGAAKVVTLPLPDVRLRALRRIRFVVAAMVGVELAARSFDIVNLFFGFSVLRKNPIMQLLTFFSCVASFFGIIAAVWVGRQALRDTWNQAEGGVKIHPCLVRDGNLTHMGQEKAMNIAFLRLQIRLNGRGFASALVDVLQICVTLVQVLFSRGYLHHNLARCVLTSAKAGHVSHSGCLGGLALARFAQLSLCTLLFASKLSFHRSSRMLRTVLAREVVELDKLVTLAQSTLDSFVGVAPDEINAMIKARQNLGPYFVWEDCYNSVDLQLLLFLRREEHNLVAGMAAYQRWSQLREEARAKRFRSMILAQQVDCFGGASWFWLEQVLSFRCRVHLDTVKSCVVLQASLRGRPGRDKLPTISIEDAKVLAMVVLEMLLLATERYSAKQKAVCSTKLLVDCRDTPVPDGKHPALGFLPVLAALTDAYPMPVTILAWQPTPELSEWLKASLAPLKVIRITDYQQLSQHLGDPVIPAELRPRSEGPQGAATVCSARDDTQLDPSKAVVLSSSAPMSPASPTSPISPMAFESEDAKCTAPKTEGVAKARTAEAAEAARTVAEGEDDDPWQLMRHEPSTAATFGCKNMPIIYFSAVYPDEVDQVVALWNYLLDLERKAAAAADQCGFASSADKLRRRLRDMAISELQDANENVKEDRIAKRRRKKEHTSNKLRMLGILEGFPDIAIRTLPRHVTGGVALLRYVRATRGSLLLAAEMLLANIVAWLNQRFVSLCDNIRSNDLSLTDLPEFRELRGAFPCNLVQGFHASTNTLVALVSVPSKAGASGKWAYVRDTNDRDSRRVTTCLAVVHEYLAILLDDLSRTNQAVVQITPFTFVDGWNPIANHRAQRYIFTKWRETIELYPGLYRRQHLSICSYGPAVTFAYTKLVRLLDGFIDGSIGTLEIHSARADTTQERLRRFVDLALLPHDLGGQLAKTGAEDSLGLAKELPSLSEIVLPATEPQPLPMAGSKSRALSALARQEMVQRFGSFDELADHAVKLYPLAASSFRRENTSRRFRHSLPQAHVTE